MLLRWVTWWPAPYWRDRFNQLARVPELHLDVVFLASGTAMHQWSDDVDNWQFKHRFLGAASDSSGYKIEPRISNPLPLLRPSADIVVMPYADARCVAATFVLAMIGKPVVLFAPNTRWDARSDSALRTRLKRMLFGLATAIFATGPAQRDYAINCGAHPDRVFTIGNPSVSYRELSAKLVPDRIRIRQKHGLLDDLVMLYVGRLSAEKGLDILFKAISRLSDNRRIHLMLVGSGPEQPALQVLARDLQIRVTFAGYLQEREVAEYYALADVFVLPSSSEPWGLVVNEAMEFGLPIVLSTHVGSAPVLLRRGENGIVFDAGDASSLASAIQTISSDPALRSRMGMASKEIISRHSVENWTQNVLSAVRQIHKMS